MISFTSVSTCVDVDLSRLCIVDDLDDKLDIAFVVRRRRLSPITMVSSISVSLLFLLFLYRFLLLFLLLLLPFLDGVDASFPSLEVLFVASESVRPGCVKASRASSLRGKEDAMILYVQQGQYKR